MAKISRGHAFDDPSPFHQAAVSPMSASKIFQSLGTQKLRHETISFAPAMASERGPKVSATWPVAATPKPPGVLGASWCYPFLRTCPPMMENPH